MRLRRRRRARTAGDSGGASVVMFFTPLATPVAAAVANVVTGATLPAVTGAIEGTRFAQDMTITAVSTLKATITDNRRRVGNVIVDADGANAVFVGKLLQRNGFGRPAFADAHVVVRADLDAHATSGSRCKLRINA